MGTQKLQNINGEVVWVEERDKPKERIKKDLLHDEAYKQFNIEDPEKLYVRDVPQKIIPKEWLSEIISLMIDAVSDPKPSHSQYNNAQLLFTMQFDGAKDSETFYDKFIEKFFETTNKYIREKGENPKDYYRSAVLGTEITDYQLNIKL